MLKVINCAVCGQPTTYKTKKSKYCSRGCKYQAIGKKSQRLWRAKNREKCRETRNSWNAANRARVYAKKAEWLARNPDAAKRMLKRVRLKRYGLSLESFEQLYDKQKGICPLCHLWYPANGQTGMVVDHCHNTGKLRGLICHHCNKALGCAKDSEDILLRMAAYIAQSRFN